MRDRGAALNVGDGRRPAHGGEGTSGRDRLFETVPILLGIASAGDGRWKQVNPAVCRTLGWDEREMLATPYMAFVHPEDVARSTEAVATLMAGRPLTDFETRVRCKDGTYRWIVWDVIPDVATGMLYCTGRDMTSRRRAERERLAAEVQSDSEVRFRLIADTLPQMVWVTRADGFHEYYNRRWYEFTGVPEGSTDGEGWNGMFHPDDQDRAWARWKRSLETGEPYEIEYRLRHRSGQYRWTLGRALPLRDERGEIERWFGTCTDIDAIKRLEAEREGLLERERRAREEAEAANRSKDRFLAVLSHELRTPLSPVLLTAGAMEADPDLPERFRDDVLTIRRNVELETNLIDDLLDLSRVMTGKLRLKAEAVSLHAQLGHVLEICAADVLAKELPLTFDLRATDDRVVGDPARLQQVFWNLLKNAVKFSPMRAPLTIRTTDADAADRVRVEVKDTGRGIAADVLPRVFDAFEQGEAGVTRQFGGLGLGLAISKGIVELHGGTIWAESDGEGLGATFVVELDRAPADVRLTGLGSKGGGVVTARRALRILLVEDHLDTAKVMGRLLARSGSTVEIAHTVADALRLGRGQTFDLLISDIGLPDGSGVDVMAGLRETGVRGIALSGFGMEEDMVRSRAAGFAEHLTKPLNLPDLAAAIERVMGT